MKNKKPIKLIGIGVATVIFLILGFFIFKNQATAPSENMQINTTQKTNDSTQLANPASQNCKKVGGSLNIKTKADGAQFGLCEFGEGMACEEWALFRGDCPAGGTDASSLDSEIQMYCVWLGGKLDNVNKNTCTLPTDKVCDTSELYNGICPTT